jgi:hypothetical protein
MLKHAHFAPFTLTFPPSPLLHPIHSLGRGQLVLKGGLLLAALLKLVAVDGQEKRGWVGVRGPKACILPSGSQAAHRALADHALPPPFSYLWYSRHSTYAPNSSGQAAWHVFRLCVYVSYVSVGWRVVEGGALGGTKKKKKKSQNSQ